MEQFSLLVFHYLKVLLMIEQNMNGKLNVENIKDGVLFSIAIPLYKGTKE